MMPIISLKNHVNFSNCVSILSTFVANSLLLELQASGGRGYLKESESSFIRRWNEGVFLPIVSPSAVQLRHILAAS